MTSLLTILEHSLLRISPQAREKAEKRAQAAQQREEAREARVAAQPAGGGEIEEAEEAEEEPARRAQPDFASMTEDEYMRWREENAVKLEPGDSLFDQHSEDSLALNLEYMSITHGFFVPFVDQCCDVVCVPIYTRMHACMHACMHTHIHDTQVQHT